MEYRELYFRGNYMLEERRRIERQRLTAASFGAWQVLQAHTDKLGTWDKYLKQLGLSDTPKATKEDLKREAEQAIKKAEQIRQIMLRAENGSR